jgi:protein-S-isoprenylcysteine O-methyltransferase Ste14
MYYARVADEERMLVEQFGDEYRDYMRRTGRLLPRLR